MASKRLRRKFYAVKAGRKPGIYTSWKECNEQVHGFPSAVYKSFETERQAQDYLAGPMPRWARKQEEKGARRARATNPNGRTQFYNGSKPPWDFLSFIDCYGDNQKVRT